MGKEWGLEEELKLAQRMKDEYCKEAVGTQFKETEPQKAAEIIYEIAKIYRNCSPDKISLIKSVGLLNAAIVRNPSNVAQIKSELSDLCHHILKESEAQNHNVDLLAKSNEVKKLFNKLRGEISESLAVLPKVDHTNSDTISKQKAHKISAITSINSKIAHEYKRIMANVSQFCEDVMGIRPCEYAVVGMGSLARMEITP